MYQVKVLERYQYEFFELSIIRITFRFSSDIIRYTVQYIIYDVYGPNCFGSWANIYVELNKYKKKDYLIKFLI